MITNTAPPSQLHKEALHGSDFPWIVHNNNHEGSNIYICQEKAHNLTAGKLRGVSILPLNILVWQLVEQE